MFNFLQVQYNRLTISLCKTFTIGLFFVLPKRVTSTFVSLSILALIFNIRKNDLKETVVCEQRFKELISVSFTEDVLLLPQHTVNWFWSESFLNETVAIENDRPVTLKEAILDNTLLHKHLRPVIRKLTSNIPSLLKRKLNLNVPSEKIKFNHDVIYLLSHS